MAHKDEEVIGLYIDAWIEKQKLSKTLVYSGMVVELISQKMFHDLDLLLRQIDEK